MSKHTAFPAFKWHPKTGESQIFNAEHEVPDGWLDTHPDNVKADEKADDKTPLSAKLPMTKKEIVKALVEGGIDYDTAAPASVLYGFLDEKLREHLTAAQVEIPEGADVPALLALIAK